ncbi:MAG: Lsr2 family protein [Bifidobacteriaceae bacterium]|jgi:hypothetical protein|nr:Lsr2 family protein [Bifidobacteriaceae bacterium]
MVQRVQYLTFDDLDGSEGAEAVVFAIDGATYEIDLNPAHAAELRRGLEPWIKAGRRLKNGRQPGRSERSLRLPKDSPSDTAKVRAWAREQGLEVSDRGRIPFEVRAAYGADH